jgi:uncharacterized Zn finger protein (UPF0148 family)
VGLGRRDARRHSTAAIQSLGGAPDESGVYSVGQTVMTLDGFPGTIEAISSGPVAGTDVYHVALDGGLGGGEYTETQISAVSSVSGQVAEASSVHTAADDYPELGTILIDRPDIAPNTRLGSKTAASESDIRSWYDATRLVKTPVEPIDDEQGGNAELQHAPAPDNPDGHMATHKGNYLGYYPNEAVARHHLYHAMHEDGDSSGQVVHRDRDEKIDRREDVRDDQRLWGTDHNSWLAKHDPKSHAVLNADDLTSRVDDAVHASPEQSAFLDSNPTGPTKYSTKKATRYPAGWFPESSECQQDLNNDGFCTHHEEYHDDDRDHVAREFSGEVNSISHPESSWLLDQHSQGPTKYSAKDNDGHPADDLDGAHCSRCKYWGINYRGGMTCPLCGSQMVAGSRSDVANQVHDPSDFTDSDADSDGDSDGSESSDSSGDSSSTTAAKVANTSWDDMDDISKAKIQEQMRRERHDAEDEQACDHPYCRENNFPEGWHTNGEHIDPVHLDPGHADYQSVEKEVNEVGKQPHVQEQLSDLDIMPHGPSKYSALDVDALLVTAVSDVDFRFQLTAAWSDVQRKAKRIRAEGGVHVTLATEGMVIGNVKGDTNVYESGLQRMPGKQSIQAWSCGCKWGAYHWGASDDFSRFAGRMCSHVLALKFEAQSRGMFGKSVYEDNDKPKWVPRKVVVKYDIDADKSLKARSSLNEMSAEAPAITLIREGALDGDLILALGIDMTAAVNSPWGEPIADVAPKAPGATQPHNPNDNPGSMGWASAPDPQNWGMQNPSMNNAEGIGGVQGSLMDEFLFEASGDDGAEAILHEEPEAALPSTDGVTVDLPRHDQNVMPAESAGMPSGKSPWQDPGNDEELTPEDLSIATMGSVDSIVAEFQKSAGHLAVDGAVNADNSDIAAAAREFLSKESVKTFTPAEQAAIINEGADQKAANLDRLDITGTHYEQVEASLSDLEDDDQLWS